MDKDYELDFTKRQLESSRSKLQIFESEHEIVEKLLSSDLSGNAVALYMHINRFTNGSIKFSREGIEYFLRTDKETAEKALQELEDNGWVIFGAIFAKHSREKKEFEYLIASVPTDFDKEYAKKLKDNAIAKD